MVEVIGRSAPIPYVEERVGISIKICCFFGTGVKRVYAVFFGDRLSTREARRVIAGLCIKKCTYHFFMYLLLLLLQTWQSLA
jgi:hypothetical protein